MISKDQEDQKIDNARKQRREIREEMDAAGDEQEEFYQKFKHDPTSTLSGVGKDMKRNEKALEKQIQYFGHVIEPFNMNQEEEIGNIDNDGFFVFKRNKNEVKDAWLDSLQVGDDDDLVKSIQKRALTGKSEGEKQAAAVKKKRATDKGVQEVPQYSFAPDEIKYLLNEILPPNVTCASYLNKVKPKKTVIAKKKNVRKNATVPTEIVEGNQEEYEKILLLVQEYIEQTGDHSIMEMKKESVFDNDEEKKPEVVEKEWEDVENKRELKKPLKPIVEEKEGEEKGEKDQDDIF